MPGTRGSIVRGKDHIPQRGAGSEIYDHEPTEEELVREVYEFAAELMEGGASERQIHDTLTESGLEPESAMIVVSNLSRMRAEAIGAAGKKEMLHGALWCLGGTAVTVVTYSLAYKGVPFVVAFGAIIFGTIQFLRGLVQWARK